MFTLYQAEALALLDLRSLSCSYACYHTRTGKPTESTIDCFLKKLKLLRARAPPYYAAAPGRPGPPMRTAHRL